MNKRDSANIAREMAASWAAAVGNDSGGEDRDPARIHSATFDQVFEFSQRTRPWP